MPSKVQILAGPPELKHFYMESILSGLVGGLLASLITAVVSIYILRKQFLREEKSLRESRAAEIIGHIEGAAWTILNGFLTEFSLNEKLDDEFGQAYGVEGKVNLQSRISEEKIRLINRVHEAERELAEQRGLVELFIGVKGLESFDVIVKRVSEVKEALGNINTAERKIKTIRPEEASNWNEYRTAIESLRNVLFEYIENSPSWL
jgi:hypothetical protein